MIFRCFYDILLGFIRKYRSSHFIFCFPKILSPNKVNRILAKPSAFRWRARNKNWARVCGHSRNWFSQKYQTLEVDYSFLEWKHMSCTEEGQSHINSPTSSSKHRRTASRQTYTETTKYSITACKHNRSTESYPTATRTKARHHKNKKTTGVWNGATACKHSHMHHLREEAS